MTDSPTPDAANCERQARLIASEIYDDEGVEMYLTARNRVLGGERPIDLIARGEGQRVIDHLNMLADGNFA